MSLYKYSQYNIVIDQKENGDIFLFNTYSSKGRLIPHYDYDDIKDNKSIDLGDVPVYLEQAGFIVPTGTDEYAYMQTDHDKIVKGSDRLDITVAVTRSCNYHCTYCFEMNELGTGVISEKVINGLTEFIRNKLNEHEYKRIRIIYFGGEPLLNIPAIKEISEELHTITDLPIIGHVTTNGRLLTPKIVDELKLCDVKTAQITLDGMPKEYAELKGCDESDFYSVIENIKKVQDDIDIQIRINVGNNKDSVKDLITFIHNENLKCSVYIDNVKYYEHDKAEFMNDYQKYVEAYRDIMTYVYENGYNKFFTKLIPCHVCGACQGNSGDYFGIDIDGNLYKCPDFIFKKEFIIGNVFDGITNNELYRTFIDNPLYDKCRDCAYRPFCQGLCTTDRLILDKGINCEALQKWYRDRIHLWITYKDKQNNK